MLNLPPGLTEKAFTFEGWTLSHGLVQNSCVSHLLRPLTLVAEVQFSVDLVETSVEATWMPLTFQGLQFEIVLWVWSMLHDQRHCGMPLWGGWEGGSDLCLINVQREVYRTWGGGRHTPKLFSTEAPNHIYST